MAAQRGDVAAGGETGRIMPRRMVVTPALEPPDAAAYFNTERPLPVAALYGVPELHAAVQDALMSWYDDRAVFFAVRSLTSEAEILPKKEKRSFVGYTPQGILKVDWIRKHQTRVFGCVMVLLDATGGAADRAGLEAAAVQLLESVKARLRGRATKVALVLVTSGTDLPHHDKFEEFASALRRKCDPDGVCQLNKQDLRNSAWRIAKDVHKLNLEYYSEAIKKVKKMKSDLNKSSQPFLFARHRFKIGFLNEILRADESALKYYQQSYDHIRAVTCDMYSVQEIKYVADVVMFRISVMRLLRGRTKVDVGEAAEKYRQHMGWFERCSEATLVPLRRGHRGTHASETSSPRRAQSFTDTHSVASQSSGGVSGSPRPPARAGMPVGRREPAAGLLHHAVTAASHERFADLLQRAYGQDHCKYIAREDSPAFHFHAAGTACRARRLHTKDVRSIYPKLSDASDLRMPTYLGQPWGGTGDSYLAALSKAEDLRQQAEQEIALCIEARNEFERGRHPKYAALVSLAIGECYSELEEWENAKQALMSVAQFFEGPWPQYQACLRLLMRCSKESNSSNDYFTCALKLIGVLPAMEGSRLCDVILAWARGEEAGMAALSPLVPASVNEYPVNDTHPFLSTHVSFASRTTEVQEPVRLRVCVSTGCQFEVRLASIEVQFRGNERYNARAAFDCVVLQGRPHVHLWDLTFDTDGEVAVESVVIGVGEQGELRLRRDFNATALGEVHPCHSVVFPTPANATRAATAASARRGYEPWATVAERPAVLVRKPPARVKIELEHSGPALLCEALTVHVAVRAGDTAVVDGSLSMTTESLPCGESLQVLAVTTVDPPAEHDTDCSRLPLGHIPAGDTRKFAIVVRSSAVAVYKFNFEAEYRTEICGGLTVAQTMELNVVHPFAVWSTVTDTIRCRSSAKDGHSTLCPMPHRSLTKQVMTTPAQPPAAQSEAKVFRRGQAARLSVTLASVVEPYGVDLLGLYLLPNTAAGVGLIPPEPPSGLLPCSLDLQEEHTATWTVQVDPDLPVGSFAPISLGSVRVRARRQGYHDTHNRFAAEPIQFDLPLPPVRVVAQPVQAQLCWPPVGSIGVPMNLTLVLRNDSDWVQEVKCSVSDSRFFFWSGRSKSAVQVLPRQEAELLYCVIPVLPGQASLPSFDVRARMPSGEYSVLSAVEHFTAFIRPGSAHQE
eukprot:TRINITY_DN36463_c0_g1_i1.p1 TRINITY_DN36463_c0_g1~~TRINITY_DN36463_c0_g1_i1.p1  ORF type:complete len:1210 (+),score=330.84 TRINITY_DN36463_c0_g1_i1:64-3630(+)